MKCSQCDAENDARLKFCEDCGAALPRVCPSCGTRVRSGKKFCGECGSSLDISVAPRFASPEAYTPKHLADRILTGRAALEGERKQVTVLFADLKGSMELLAGRDPEEARKLLDPVLERMMEAVHRYEGTVNQVMGDGIMALFGAPLAHEDHAVRGCHAALRMQESIQDYAKQIPTAVVPINIRIGLNSGEVVVRSIGSDLRMDYSAVGQTTHLAARLEQIASPGCTLISAATLGLADGQVAVAARGPTLIKGLSEPIEIYELTGAGPTRTRFQASTTRGLTRFVGRSSELTQMFAALVRAQDAQGELLALVGEPGVGKSRLVWEFTHSPSMAGLLVLESGSVSYGKANAWQPVIDLLRAYFGIAERDDGRAVREKVAAKLRAQSLDLATLLSPLLYLLDVPSDDQSWERLEPTGRRVRILEACRRLLLREAHAQPLLLVFEDLHWIDNETQALLDVLVESLPSVRMLLLVNYRPEYQHRWSGKSYYTQVRVDPLVAANAEELLDALLGRDRSLDPVRQILLQRTGRNPFFLEESVRTLMETGALEGVRGAFRMARSLSEIEVPATVQAMLAARIDRLPAEGKRLLQMASVVGKDVPVALLMEIAGLPAITLRTALGDLQAAEFLYETNVDPDLEYTFKHALTHDVAYGSLLHDKRRALHAQILDAIERMYADRLVEHVERLGRHAFRGEAWAKAVDYLRQAGSRAFNRSANREAAMHLEQAVDALSHLPQTSENLQQAVDLRIALWSCLLPLGEQMRGLELARQAEPLADTLNDTRRAAVVQGLIGGSLANLGHLSEGLACGIRAVALADSVGDAALAVTARFHVGLAHRFFGAYRKALEFFEPDPALVPEELIDPYRSQSSPDLRYRASAAHYYLYSLNNCSHCLTELGELEEAAGYSDRAAKMADALELRYPRVLVDAVTGHLRLRQGDLVEAVCLLERCIETYESVDARFGILVMTGMLGPAYTLSGRVPDAIALFERTGDFAEAQGLVSFNAPVLAHLGHAYSRAGRFSEAIDAASLALDLARSYRMRGYEAWALYVLGEIRSAAAPLDALSASQGYEDGKSLAQELQMRPLEAMCRLGLGTLYARSGERERAATELTASASACRLMGMRLWLEKAEATLKSL